MTIIDYDVICEKFSKADYILSNVYIFCYTVFSIPHVFAIPKELHLLKPVRWYSVRNCFC